MVEVLWRGARDDPSDRAPDVAFAVGKPKHRASGCTAVKNNSRE